MSKQHRLKIIRDDREKKPWGLSVFGSDVEVVTARLRTGDYTIEAMDELFVVERKRNWREFHMNSIGRHRDNFIRMLRRMREFPFPYIVVEDTFDAIYTFKTWSGLSIDRNLILNMILNMSLEYGIQVITVGKPPKCYPIIRALFRKVIDFNYNGRLYDGG